MQHDAFQLAFLAMAMKVHLETSLDGVNHVFLDTCMLPFCAGLFIVS